MKSKKAYPHIVTAKTLFGFFCNGMGKPTRHYPPIPSRMAAQKKYGGNAKTAIAGRQPLIIVPPAVPDAPTVQIKQFVQVKMTWQADIQIWSKNGIQPKIFR